MVFENMDIASATYVMTQVKRYDGMKNRIMRT